MTTPEKLIIVVTHGPEDPELATLPFVMAAAAIVSDVEVAMAFQSNGVNLVRKGGAEHVFTSSFPPLVELLESVVELGGKLMACAPCLESRKLSAPDDLRPEVEIIGAARLVAEIMGATTTLTY